MATSAEGLLKAEIAYYDEHITELLLTYPNRFVLIHGDQLIGTFESHAEAVGEGVRRYGRGPFLVRRTSSGSSPYSRVNEDAMNTEAEEELAQIVERLNNLVQRGAACAIVDPLSALQESAEEVGKSASGSWMGYHALVYYDGFNRPPPDAHFDHEWGLVGEINSRTRGNWTQYDYDTVVDAIQEAAGHPDVGRAKDRQLAGGFSSDMATRLFGENSRTSSKIALVCKPMSSTECLLQAYIALSAWGKC